MRCSSIDKIKIFIGLIVLIMSSCRSSDPNDQGEASIPYQYSPQSDSVLQRLIAREAALDFQGWTAYLNHRNPAYRYQALRPYAVQRDVMNPDHIYSRLLDSIPEVQRMGHLCSRSATRT